MLKNNVAVDDLKQLMNRGIPVGPESMIDFIYQVDLGLEPKQELLALSPAITNGAAEELARRVDSAVIANLRDKQ